MAWLLVPTTGMIWQRCGDQVGVTGASQAALKRLIIGGTTSDIIYVYMLSCKWSRWRTELVDGRLTQSAPDH